MKKICFEIETDKDYVHFLIQSAPILSPARIIQTVKSITAKLIFKHHPKVKKQLRGGEFWTKGFYVSTVGAHGYENTIQKYVQAQGRQEEYTKLHSQQLRSF